jgi:hypothetical protein
MKTNREKAIDLLEKLTNDGDGVTHQMLLEYLINDYMDASRAYEALKAAEEEFFGSFEDADDDFESMSSKKRFED